MCNNNNNACHDCNTEISELGSTYYCPEDNVHYPIWGCSYCDAVNPDYHASYSAYRPSEELTEDDLPF